MEENTNMPAPESGAPMTDMQKKSSSKGLIIGLIVLVVIGAAAYLSTQTDLLKGTFDIQGGDQQINFTDNTQNRIMSPEERYNQALENAKSEAEKDMAHSTFIKETVDVLESQ